VVEWIIDGATDNPALDCGKPVDKPRETLASPLATPFNFASPGPGVHQLEIEKALPQMGHLLGFPLLEIPFEVQRRLLGRVSRKASYLSEGF